MILFRFGLIFCALIVVTFCSPLIPPDNKLAQSKFSPKCGPQSCHKTDPGKINVHIVPHSHDDVGWLKTVDQYYYGKINKWSNQKAGVQYILDSVVRELVDDPLKRFIYVESAFFFKWFNDQANSTKTAVYNLVQEGRLEFISGGWSMNDEAAAHYNSIIDMMTLGFRHLRDTFGECAIPKIGWQIDPFGHSKEQANLFAQMSFDGLFFSRMDYEDAILRSNEKRLEFVWKASDDLGSSSDLFTHRMLGTNLYYSPDGFNWDNSLFQDNPIIDDRKSREYNVDKIVNEFLDVIRFYASKYTTNHVMIPFGGDFDYQDAHSYFKNMDKLIEYVNGKQSNYSINYSTPSCYLNAVHEQNKTYTTKSDDLFPYANDPHSYWTGYFTSRPSSKHFERIGNSFLQIVKQLDVLAGFNYSRNQEKISPLREAMGIFQHHDAISGTEKQHVADDYALVLSEAMSTSANVVRDAYDKLLPKGSVKAPIQMFCPAWNVSACPITEGSKPVAITLWNPIARQVNFTVKFPVTSKAYKVLDPSGNEVKATLIPISKEVLNIPGRVSKAVNELGFQVTLPALGFATYLIQPTEIKLKNPLLKSLSNETNSVLVAKGKSFKLMFDSTNGALKSVKLANGNEIPLENSFHYYKGMKGNNSNTENRASGAYVFRPDGQTPIFLGETLSSKLFENEFVTEVHQTWNEWVSQVVRVYKDSDVVEFDYVIGPIDVSDNIGKEIIARYDSKLKSNATFFTDANGRQIMKRKRDFRPTWKLQVTEPVSENYYPINSRIFIQDVSSNQQMTILNDRSQGGSSMQDGSIEIMVHRRLLYDDAFGVGEPLNETAYGKGLVIRGKHYMIMSSIKDAPRAHRDLSQKLFLKSMPTFSTFGNSKDYFSNFKTSYSGLTSPLPPNIHLLSLENWREGEYLVRLEHFYQTNEDEVLSKPVTIELKKLFVGLNIEDAIEMTLGGNQELSKSKRMKFNTNEKQDDKDLMKGSFNRQSMSVTISPMQIRTFILKTKK